MIFYCVLPLYQINATAVIPRCYAARGALETNLVRAARAACTVVISRFLCCALQMVGTNKTEKKKTVWEERSPLRCFIWTLVPKENVDGCVDGGVKQEGKVLLKRVEKRLNYHCKGIGKRTAFRPSIRFNEGQPHRVFIFFTGVAPSSSS